MVDLTAYSPKTLQQIGLLEKICGHDVGRGIKPLVKFATGGLLRAAHSLLEKRNLHVAIVTGFYLPHGTPPGAETDGPIGCVQLACSLARVGYRVRIVTDSLCFPTVKQAAIAIGIPRTVEFDIVPIYTNLLAENSNEIAVRNLIKTWLKFDTPVSHLIAIERPGIGQDGKMRNMRGDDITNYTAPLHLLFQLPNVIKIAIGDGGNEIGMGNIPRSIIHTHIRHGEKIGCIIPCDFLIVCGVSNWGATGILIALALLRPEWQNHLLQTLTPEIEFHILESIVSKGLAVDGVTGKANFTVDNLAWEYHKDNLLQAKRILDYPVGTR